MIINIQKNIIINDTTAYYVFVVRSFMKISVPFHRFYGCCFCFNKENKQKPTIIEIYNIISFSRHHLK